MTYEKGLTWQEIHYELDVIDEKIERDNQHCRTVELGKDMFFECDKHEIKYRGCAGGCPLCLLRTFFEEKERMGAEYAEAQGFIEDWRLKQ